MRSLSLAQIAAQAAALIAALGLASCQTPCVSPYEGPVRVSFLCEDDSRLEVTFTRQPDVALVVQEGFAPATLPARITGSGYRYGDEGIELRGTGAEARWSRPGGGETLCREVSAPAQSQSQARAPQAAAHSTIPAAGTRDYCRA